MKKIFNFKLATLMLGLCLVLGNISAVPAYAMENNESSTNQAICTDENIVPYAGHDILYYGQVIDILNGVSGHKITVTGTNLTPYKIVQNDPRMHRLIFDFGVVARQNVNFKITVRTQYHGEYTTGWIGLSAGQNLKISNNPDYTGVYEDLRISPGEQVSFYFEVSPSSGSVDITRFNVYCD